MRRLLVALVTPWVLLGLAYSVPLLQRAFLLAGYDIDWVHPADLVWFYAFGFSAVLSIPTYFIVGVCRLVLRAEYRRSWYGWWWLVLMWLNLCVLTSAPSMK